MQIALGDSDLGFGDDLPFGWRTPEQIGPLLFSRGSVSPEAIRYNNLQAVTGSPTRRRGLGFIPSQEQMIS